MQNPENQNFKFNSELNSEPAQRDQQECNVGALGGSSQEPCSRVLYNLQMIHGGFIDSGQDSVTTIVPRRNKSVNKNLRF